MSIASPRAARRGAVRATVAAATAAALVFAARPAAAQCPVGAVCTFGTDETGSQTTRAANVQALAARTAFFSRLTGVGTETFEGYADGTPIPLTLSFAGAGNATLNGAGLVLTQGAGADGDGRYPVSGTRYLETYTTTGATPAFRIDFANPVAAFGFYGIDVGEFGSQLALRFTLVGGATTTWTLPYLATNGVNTRRDGSLFYAGFIAPTDFTSVAFLGTADDDYFALDDLSVGARAQVAPTAVVPEPATGALVAGGLALAGGVAARRRRPTA